MTTAAPPPWFCARVVEGLDDAEHGAEEADEGRVVAERAQDAEVLLQGQALARARTGHGLDRRRGSARQLLEADQRDPDLRALRIPEQLARRLEIALGHGVLQLLTRALEVDPAPRHGDAALDHDRHGQNGQQHEQPQDPFRSK